MNWNKVIRATHRWVSIVFTFTVILNFVAIGMKSQATWVGFLAVPPLLILLLTGLYLFALPYLARRGGGTTS
jgi:hypothetical protein